MAVRYDGPDHWAPLTWPRCVVEGCSVRLDPWEHRTRCDDHQGDMDYRRERAHAIVTAERERATANG